jgi:hypothetical protein
MKIDVTYEKKDILRLIEKDLLAEGIRVKEGTALVYKGALEVKLSVETEDTGRPLPQPAPSASKAVVPAETLGPRIEPADDGDMSSVLAASNRLVKAPDGRVRSLGPNETLEFPKG